MRYVVAILILIVSLLAWIIFKPVEKEPAKIPPKVIEKDAPTVGSDVKPLIPKTEPVAMTDNEKILAHGKTLVKAAPPVGNPNWLQWYLKLSKPDQLAYLLAQEQSGYPSGPTKEDWQKVKVASGPGANSNDYFPCKVLTDYKPLLQINKRIGVVGLQFSIDRHEGSIVTSIWAANAKGAISVDWMNDKVLPANIDSSTAGLGLIPQFVPSGAHISGSHGKIGVQVRKNSGGNLEWKPGYRAYPLALTPEEPIAFGIAYHDTPRYLDSIVCLSHDPPKLLGEIKMPESKTIAWCIYDRKNKVLLVGEHDWHWIAMIDFSKPNDAKSANSGSKP